MSDWIRHTEEEQKSDKIILAFKNTQTREGKYISQISEDSFSVQYWPDLAKEMETISVLGSGSTKEEAARVLAEHVSGFTEEDLVTMVE